MCGVSDAKIGPVAQWATQPAISTFFRTACRKLRFILFVVSSLRNGLKKDVEYTHIQNYEGYLFTTHAQSSWF